MKKILAITGALALAASLFVSCASKTATTESTAAEPAKTAEVEKQGPAVVTVATNADTVWEHGAVDEDIVFNDDGTVTYNSWFKYGGGGYAFNIFDGKQSLRISDYMSIELVFDYEICDGWTNDELNPNFTIKGYPSGAKFFENTVDLGYINGDAHSGTITASVDLFGKGGKLQKIGVCSNAWQWAGDGEVDKVKITVKSISFTPLPF